MFSTLSLLSFFDFTFLTSIRGYQITFLYERAIAKLKVKKEIKLQIHIPLCGAGVSPGDEINAFLASFRRPLPPPFRVNISILI